MFDLPRLGPSWVPPLLPSLLPDLHLLVLLHQMNWSCQAHQVGIRRGGYFITCLVLYNYKLPSYWSSYCGKPICGFAVGEPEARVWYGEAYQWYCETQARGSEKGGGGGEFVWQK